MLDSRIRTLIDPPLNKLGKFLAGAGLSANQITFLGFILGLLAMGAICFKLYILGLSLFCLNRVADGLDGAVARHKRISDFGGFLDIVLDFIIYAGMVFAFGMSNFKNLPYALFLIFSFVGPMSSFLAYATIAAKHNIHTEIRGKKSFYYLGGLCEGTETAIFLALMCIFPTLIPVVCIIFGVMCWITTAGRIYRAFLDFA